MPEQVLHVMPDLVRDDIGLREVAGRAEAPIELAEERQVEVDLLIGRAIERAAGRQRPSRTPTHGVLEQHQHRLAILPPGRREHAAPGLLGVAKHDRDELGLLDRWSARRSGR